MCCLLHWEAWQHLEMDTATCGGYISSAQPELPSPVDSFEHCSDVAALVVFHKAHVRTRSATLGSAKPASKSQNTKHENGVFQWWHSGGAAFACQPTLKDFCWQSVLNVEPVHCHCPSRPRNWYSGGQSGSPPLERIPAHYIDTGADWTIMMY